MAKDQRDIDAAFEELLDDEKTIEDAEEIHDDAGPEGSAKASSQLQDGLGELENLLGGIASRLLGPNATKRMEIDPDKPVISPEVDKVIEDIGDTLGRLLTQAGDGLKNAARKPDAAPDPDAEPETVEPELEGWSPLVIGARAFASGVGAVAADVVEKLGPAVEQALNPNASEE